MSKYKYKLKFDENYEFLADLKFLNEYIVYFNRINFIDLWIVKWWDWKNKTTFKKQLVMYSDFLKYFPYIFKKYTKKEINIKLFNIYIINQIFFIFINNKRIWIKWFSLLEIYNFIKYEIWNLLYIFSLILFPIYFIYIFINIKNNFKFPIYFNK